MGTKSYRKVFNMLKQDNLENKATNEIVLEVVKFFF